MVGEESEVGEGIRYLDCLPDVTIGSIDGGQSVLVFLCSGGDGGRAVSSIPRGIDTVVKHLFTY